MNLPLGYYPHSCLVVSEIYHLAYTDNKSDVSKSVRHTLELFDVPVIRSSSGHITVTISDLMDANLIKEEYL